MNRFLFRSALPLFALPLLAQQPGAPLPPPSIGAQPVISQTSRLSRIVAGPDLRPSSLILRNGTFVALSPALSQQLPGTLHRGARIDVTGAETTGGRKKTIQAQHLTVNGVAYDDTNLVAGGPPPAGGPTGPTPPAGVVARAGAPGAPPPPPPAGRGVRGLPGAPPPPPPAGAPGASAPPPPPPPPPAGVAGAPAPPPLPPPVRAGGEPVLPPPPPPPAPGAALPATPATGAPVEAAPLPTPAGTPAPAAPAAPLK